jgi:hypothetical protein
VEVIGATVAVVRYAMALSRVSTTSGLRLSGRGNLIEPNVAPAYSAGHAASDFPRGRIPAP